LRIEHIKKLSNIILIAFLYGCCNVNTNSGINYYSASGDTYYQIESKVSNSQTSYTLNIMSQSGSLY